MAITLRDLLILVLAFVLPPVAVILIKGKCDCDLVINMLLCCLAWVPGTLHAIYLQLTKDKTLFLYGWHVPARLRLRHIPGPPPRWLTGNVRDLLGADRHTAFQRLADKHGSVYKIFLGAEPYVVVADAELARLVLLRNYLRPENSSPGSFTTNKQQLKQQQSSLGATSDRNFHKALKSAWLPSMNSATLLENSKLMDASARRMADLLEEPARNGTEVNIYRHFGKMTLDVVGTTALGVQFNTQDPSGQQTPESQEIITAVQDFFRFGGDGSSIYSRLVKVFPEAKPLLCRVAMIFPDKPMVQVKEAHRVMSALVHKLVERTRAELQETSGVSVHARAGGEEEAAAARAAAALAGAGAHNNGERDEERPGERPGERRKPRGVAAGTFPRQMVAAVNPLTGQPLDNSEVAAQLITFLLAGYETTATTLGFTTFCLVSNPDKLAKLLKEVDALPCEGPLLPEHLQSMIYAEACYREALRLYGPITTMGRVAVEDMQLGPHFIPKGTRFIVPFFAIQRNAAYWPDPEAFVPERFLEGEPEHRPHTPGAWMPFGEGTRICAGQRFAIQEIKIALARLFQRYTFELQPGQVPMELDAAVTLAPKSLSIRVVPVRR